MISFTRQFDSFLGANIESNDVLSTRAPVTGLFFTSANSFSFSIEIENPPLPLPTALDLVMAEYTIRNGDGSINFVITTFTAAVTLPVTGIIINTAPTASNINRTPINPPEAIQMEIGENRITIASGSITLANQPTLPVFPTANRDFTISFRLFVNNGLYIAKTYQAEASVVWQSGLSSSILTNISFFQRNTFSGDLSIFNSPFLMSLAPINGTIKATKKPGTNPTTDPGFDIQMTLTTDLGSGQYITGHLKPESSYLNSTSSQLLSYISGNLVPSEVILQLDPGQILNGYAGPIPMLSQPFPGSITLTQGPISS